MLASFVTEARFLKQSVMPSFGGVEEVDELEEVDGVFRSLDVFVIAESPTSRKMGIGSCGTPSPDVASGGGRLTEAAVFVVGGIYTPPTSRPVQEY